jgi:CheY-like chemotaxis protein
MSDTKRIMIVEDSLDIQNLLASILESEGYGVDRAMNGYEALEKLRSSVNPPSLVLLDLMMPIMDGYELQTHLQNDPKLSQIPIAVMTAEGDVHSKAVRIGAKAYLKKPFTDIETILETVGRFFA